LDFAGNALSRDETEVETVILSEGELAGWYIGEPDEFYDDGLCRTFYHEEGPPPVLINCVFQQSRFSVWDWLDYYQELDFIDMTFATRYEYQAPYFIFMDFTSGGYPRYAFAMESEDIFINLDLIIPRLMPGTDFEDSFTESIDNVIQQAVQISLDHQSGQ
jgi:hypothetical protein